MNNRGMGFVYQPKYRNGDGVRVATSTWWISYPNHGKQIRENAKTTNRAEAVRLLKQRIADVAGGKPVGSQVERTTLHDLLEMGRADYIANGRRSAARVKAAAFHLERHFGAWRKARDITTDAVTGYEAARRNEGAKPATVNIELAMLRRGFRLGKHRVASSPDIRIKQANNTRKGFFEREPFEAVLRHLPEPLKQLAECYYVTGWRKSELRSRQWRHVDFDNGWLRLEPGESKNDEGREFPLTSQLRAALQAQRAYVRETEQRAGQIIPWVFCYPNGRPVGDFRKAWSTACEKAGVRRMVHDFRRTAVRNLERAGVPRSAAMKMTGHKTESVYRRYAIVDSGMLKEAAAKLEALHEMEANKQSSVKVVKLTNAER